MLARTVVAVLVPLLPLAVPPLSTNEGVRVTGTVIDGSGHGWPLYARITVDGAPEATALTDPVTGTYTLDLPPEAEYDLTVSPVYPGYLAVTETVRVGAGEVTQDFAVPVDAATCDAPGYGVTVGGEPESFDAGTLPDGWSIADHLGNGQVWRFDNPLGRLNSTGGSGAFPMVDSFAHIPGRQDTSLVTPPIDLTGAGAPAIRFRQDFLSIQLAPALGDVDLSVDGGATWQTVHHQDAALPGPRQDTVSLAAAAGQADVRVRFRYTATVSAFGSALGWWEIDDVEITDCDPIEGGLVLGRVTDGNTGGGVTGARIAAGGFGVSDPDGFYWLFSPGGTHQLTASAPSYRPATRDVEVAANAATRADFTLAAGKLAVTPVELAATAPLGQTRSLTFTVRNTGTEPATIDLAERRGGVELLQAGVTGGVVHRVPGTFSPLSHAAAGRPAPNGVAQAAPSAEPWTGIADYPESTMDAGAALVDGELYSFGGFDGSANTNDAFVHDPVRRSWKAISRLPVAGLENPAVEAIDGRIYITGGWNADGSNNRRGWAYDPAADTYTEVASQPVGLAASGRAVLHGSLYTVGGCQDACTFTDVQRYDPGSDTWTRLAGYPEPIAHVACGAIGDAIYCAGGIGPGSGTRNGYAYDPATDRWTPIAPLPIDLWGMSYTAAGEQLLVAGGVTASGDLLTNQSFAYRPDSNAWTELPPASRAVFRGGSACGFYRIGGSIGDFNPTRQVEQLPGFDDCDDAVDVDWLSADPTGARLDPGGSATIRVTVDSSVLLQPGTYTAGLTIREDTPYPAPAVGVRLDVTPPGTWGRLTGLVQGVDCDGTRAPLSGVTVQIDGRTGGWTLLTGTDGRYGYWIDRRANPLTLIVAKDGYQLEVVTVRIRAGETVTANFDLPRATC